MFYGVASLSLDSKGRMTIPVRYREYLSEKDEKNNILALVESADGCLFLMKHSMWLIKVEELLKNGTQEERRFWIGLSDTPELDKSGRVLINSVLREGAAINKDVVLLGVGNHLEIWDEKRLEKHKSDVRKIKSNLKEKAL
ncbi:MAG: hypothetical protein CBD16_06835 [Betaproteobacteria bacterium TMED156]|nr:MAG: hypothetical protein CBD16_06835 [Betaproteobacteria bacterium TMED156]|tara:strand:+ start:225 stop:647 length:423 start_codon:yes stop_codon:yes gene_type:complete